MLALVFSLLAPASALGQAPSPHEGKIVQDVRFEGLKRVSPKAALVKIDLRPGERFSADLLAKDVEKLVRWGQFESPADTSLPPVSARVEPVPGGVRIVFVVHERPRVKEVRITDEGPFKNRSEIDELVATKKDGLFDRYRVAVDARALRDKAVERGYLFAQVDARTQVTKDGVQVELVVLAGPRVHVEKIVLEGAAKIPEDDVKSALSDGPNALETKERRLFGFLEEGRFDRRAFRRDLDRIARYYRSQGYLDARVYLEKYDWNEKKTELTVRIRVEEGERYTVRSVSLEGIRVLDEEKVRAGLKTRPGRPLLGDDLVSDMREIQRAYADKAYIHAEVLHDFRYDRERKLVDVTFRVSEGPKVRIDRIRIEGNDRTREKVIRRELSFFPGEYYEGGKIEQSLQRLGRLRYFKDVRFEFEPGSEAGREDFVLKVEETRTGSFVIGGGVSTSTGVFGNLSVTQKNFDLFAPPTSFRDLVEGHAFAGGGQTVSIALQPGRERNQYSVSFVEPWLFDVPVRLGIDGFIFDRQREDWFEARIGVRPSLGYRIVPLDLTVTGSYRFEQVRVTDVRAGAVPDVIEVSGLNYVSAVKLQVSYDQNVVDRHFVMHAGYSVGVAYEIAGGVLGGNADFGRLTAEGNWQHTLLEWPGEHKWVFRLSGELGYMTPYGQTRRTPIFERLFAGGPQSIRGFEFRGVGPKRDGKPVGGDFLGLASAELSFPLFQHYLRGVGFVDTGILEKKIGDVKGSHYRVSAGFGFRLALPVFPAPVALDFGWPILRLPDDAPQVFSFSVGLGF